MSDLTGPVVVAGGGGFIGGHLINHLRRLGHTNLRAVDVKPGSAWFQRFDDVENLEMDLRDRQAAEQAVAGACRVYNLACDMGGMGFIETHRADCMISVLINTNLLLAARDAGCDRYYFASSACVYPQARQASAAVTPLKESDAYPADPEDGYGWEKLFGERMCRHFSQDFGVTTRVGRYHNIYGPLGVYEGGREKAPAAICRKIAEAKLTGNHVIEIWGDGEQTRSFTYIDDCLEGTLRLMDSRVEHPLNIGSDQLVTINQLVSMVEEIASVKLERRYRLDAPQGVRGRNSDNALIQNELGWSPSTRLEEGLVPTYRWVYDQVVAEYQPRLSRSA